MLRGKAAELGCRYTAAKPLAWSKNGEDARQDRSIQAEEDAVRLRSHPMVVVADGDEGEKSIKCAPGIAEYFVARDLHLEKLWSYVSSVLLR